MMYKEMDDRQEAENRQGYDSHGVLEQYRKELWQAT